MVTDKDALQKCWEQDNEYFKELAKTNNLIAEACNKRFNEH